MSELIIQKYWEELPGHADPLVRFTMARVEVRIGNACITNCTLGDRTSNQVISPLYSLAEWFAANWWGLFFEPFVPERNGADFDRRHSLLSARDGFALPDLRFRPDGMRIIVAWEPYQTTFQELRFFERGTAAVDRSQMQDCAAKLIGDVIERLIQKGIKDSWLESEWESIQNLSSEEREFCTASGRLGLDPFEVLDSDAEVINLIWRALPESVREDAFDAVGVVALPEFRDWVVQNVANGEQATRVNGVDWKSIRKHISQPISNLPWNEGYQLAREVLKIQNWTNEFPVPFRPGESIAQIPSDAPPSRSVDGLLVIGKANSPVCCTHKKIPSGIRFQCARALGEFFFEINEMPILLSSAYTFRQKRSRAFAAELLAPESLLRKSVGSNLLNEDEIEDLAQKFEVSSSVIKHQLENHRIAVVVARD